jgi:hypothetical protein
MFTEIVQIPIGVRLLLKLMLPLPAAAVTVPPQVLVTPGVAATCNPRGNVSVKLPLIATTFGLLMLKFTVVVPFTGIVAAPKLLVICGGSKMMIPTLAVPPLEAPSPAGAV